MAMHESCTRFQSDLACFLRLVANYFVNVCLVFFNVPAEQEFIVVTGTRAYCIVLTYVQQSERRKASYHSQSRYLTTILRVAFNSY